MNKKNLAIAAGLVVVGLGIATKFVTPPQRLENAVQKETTVTKTDSSVVITTTLMRGDTGCPVPAPLVESSGLMTQGGETGSSFNDGSPAKDCNVYRLNFVTGKITRKTLLVNARNTDWEDMAFTSDSMCLGDFGNNSASRSTFRLWKTRNSGKTQDTVLVCDTINYHLPKFAKKNTETLIWNKDFYIVTKEKVGHLYKINNGGSADQEAVLIDTCSLGFLATGGAISADKKKILIGCERRFNIYTNWKGDDYFTGTKTVYDLPDGNQFEGFSFGNGDSSVNVISETNKIRQGIVVNIKIK